jgi:Ran GTPase-activating protein (RanGAP) involved in mRNA processing and transport
MPLAKAVEAHTSLTTLHLSYNRLQDASVLASSLAMNRSSLVELNLDHNMLGEDTALALAAMLQTNRRLKLLDLNSNSLHDRGGVALARSLRDNTSLRRLGMARTGIGAETAESFLRTLQDNVTLCRLRLEANQPNLPGILERRCLYLVQANRSGRYLLRDGQGKRNNSDDTKGCNTGIWPFVLERLGPDMVFFFLREDPGLVPSNC